MWVSIGRQLTKTGSPLLPSGSWGFKLRSPGLPTDTQDSFITSLAVDVKTPRFTQHSNLCIAINRVSRRTVGVVIFLA